MTERRQWHPADKWTLGGIFGLLLTILTIGSYLVKAIQKPALLDAADALAAKGIAELQVHREADQEHFKKLDDSVSTILARQTMVIDELKSLRRSIDRRTMIDRKLELSENKQG